MPSFTSSRLLGTTNGYKKALEQATTHIVGRWSRKRQPTGLQEWHRRFSPRVMVTLGRGVGECEPWVLRLLFVGQTPASPCSRLERNTEPFVSTAAVPMPSAGTSAWRRGFRQSHAKTAANRAPRTPAAGSAPSASSAGQRGRLRP